MTAVHFCLQRPAATLLTSCAFGIWLQAGQSLADDSALCVNAAQDAADLSGVPVSVLLAIALTETGTTRDGETRPWPWTVNVGGEGYWFETASAAEQFARETLDRGTQSFDVGCFQLNYRWHGENFVSIEQMFDPMANATYAASFLNELNETRNDWSAAAGAYHSQNEQFASRYRNRFDAYVTALAEGGLNLNSVGDLVETVNSTVPSLPRRNDFPLLQQNNGVRALGSLVTLASRG